jgi:hypothetical protein
LGRSILLKCNRPACRRVWQVTHFGKSRYQRFSRHQIYERRVTKITHMLSIAMNRKQSGRIFDNNFPQYESRGFNNRKIARYYVYFKLAVARWKRVSTCGCVEKRSRTLVNSSIFAIRSAADGWVLIMEISLSDDKPASFCSTTTKP